MYMKLKIALILITFITTAMLASCGNSTGSSQKIDVEKYREKVRESRKEGSITPEERKEGLKSIFPKIKDDRE